VIGQSFILISRVYLRARGTFLSRCSARSCRSGYFVISFDPAVGSNTQEPSEAVAFFAIHVIMLPVCRPTKGLARNDCANGESNASTKLAQIAK